MPYLAVVLMFVFFAALAMSVGEGLWSNTIGFLAVMFAGIFAVAVGFPLGLWAQEKFAKPDDFLWHFLFAGVWLAFFLFVLIFRILSERISKIRMRFVPPLETAGGLVMGLLLATLYASFAAFTLLIPMAAKNWDLSTAESWQQTVFTVGASPFMTVYKRTTGEDLNQRVDLR